MTGASEDYGTVEIAFNQPVFDADTGGSLTAADFTLYVTRGGTGNTSVYPGDEFTTFDNRNDSRFLVGVPEGDSDPVDTVQVDVGAVRTDAGVGRDIGNVSVKTSSSVIREGGHASTRSEAWTIYTGEPINFQASAVDTHVFVRNIETGEIVLDGRTGASSQYITFDSDDLRSGATYKVIFSQTDATSGAGQFFNTTSLGLEAALAENGTTFGEGEDATLTVEASAIRGNAPIVVDTGINQYREQLSGLGEFSKAYDEGDVSTDTTTVTVTDARTGVTAVAGTYDATGTQHADSASFPNSILTENRGDVVEIPITLQNTVPGAKATLQVGSLGDDNYVTNLTVVDEDGDGEVVVEWNTFTAGVNDLNRVFDVHGDDSIAKWEWERGVFVDTLRDRTYGRPGARTNYTYAKNLTLDATDYDLKVVANGGDNPKEINNFTDVDEDDIGSVDLGSNSVDTSRVWVAPSQRTGDIDLEFVHDNLDNNPDEVDGNLTQSEQVAEGEAIVQQIETSGVEGVLKNRTDAGQSLQHAFLGETEEYLASVGDTGEVPEWSVNYVERQTDSTDNPRQLDVTADAFDFLADYDNDTYFIVVNLDEVDRTKLVDGGTWWANVTFNNQTDLNRGGGQVSDEWEYVDAGATLDTDANGKIVVQQAENQTISGDTSVAPGTNLEIRITSQADASPFLETPMARVSEDGSFSTTVDFFADVNRGTEFTAVVYHDGDRISPDYDGVVGDQNESVSDGHFDGVSAQYNADGNDVIDISELGTAAADYARGDLSITELGSVAAAYAQS